MKRILKLVVLWASSVIVVLLAVGLVSQWVATSRALRLHPAPGRLVDVGGHRLHVWCKGEGGPTVVLARISNLIQTSRPAGGLERLYS